MRRPHELVVQEFTLRAVVYLFINQMSANRMNQSQMEKFAIAMMRGVIMEPICHSCHGLLDLYAVLCR